MSTCKGVVKDVQKQAEMLNMKLSGEIAESIAQKTECFIVGLLKEATEICNENKRKIVMPEDIRQTISRRGLEILYPLFDE
ncbi:uncharacterized protein VICG_00488 [Vittaforma corneae ATCC 50505]|uniref:Transcription factor CBF/NF-Y/archaeal histone domain-containing protein n=1 Tax=Vittaforma corneae (strain ATCC 50505) TaxID=993615 RepID=L2GP31_VITCO|nr:uncharacterized protein VICG_00488 [Vittaforma corneae ATCC 50505]ELA42389.1 hypothetical protein VICG_00488 [Vittaforma corneae ATCC 50505]